MSAERHTSYVGLFLSPYEYFMSFLGFPLFLLSEPWTMGFSKSFKRKFFYNKKTKTSTFDLPADSIAPFQ